MVTDRMDPLALQGAKQGRRGHARHPLCPAGSAAGRSAGAGERSYYGPSGRASGQNVTRPRRDGVRALMAIVGYARVSTLDQVLDSQVDEITASGATRIFTDKASGKLDARPGLAAALDLPPRPRGRRSLWSPDRPTRPIRATPRPRRRRPQGTWHRVPIPARGHRHPTAGGEMFFVIFAAIGQFSGRIISERTHEGLAAARARGRRGGRPRAMTPDKLATAVRMRSEGRTLDHIAATIGVSASTVSRALADALEEAS